MKQDATSNGAPAPKVAPKRRTKRPAKRPAKFAALHRLLREKLNPAAFRGSTYGTTGPADTHSVTARWHGPVEDYELYAGEEGRRSLALLLDSPTVQRMVGYRRAITAPTDGGRLRLAFRHATPNHTKQMHSGEDGLYTKYDWHCCRLTGEWFHVPHGGAVPVVVLGEDWFIVHPGLVAAGPAAVSAAMLRAFDAAFDKVRDALDWAYRLGAALPGIPEDGIAPAWPEDAYRRMKNVAKKGEPARYDYVRAGYEPD